jgi:hypothetical protein
MTPPNPRQQHCLESIQQRIQQDAFLFTADQSPRLEQLLAELDSVLQHDEYDAGQRLLNTIQNIGKHAESLTGILRELRAPLEHALGTLQQDSSSPSVDAAVSALSTGSEMLARRLRHQLLHLLDDAAPSQEIVPKLLAIVTAGRDTAVQTLPQTLWVLRARQPDDRVQAGQSLAAQHIIPELEALCQSPWLSRWRLRRLRRRLRGRYQLIEVDLREVMGDTLLRHSDISVATLVQRHRDTHVALEDQLHDAWRALRYAIDTALVELADLHSAPAEQRAEILPTKTAELTTLITQAFDKTGEVLHDSAEVYTTIFQGMLAELAQDREHAFAAARLALAGAYNASARWRSAWKTLCKSTRRFARQWLDRGKTVLPLTQQLLQQLLRRGEHRWLQLNELLRLGEAPEESLLGIADLPVERELATHLQTLSPVYRRLFSSEPLLNREFLVGRNDELQTLADAYKRWRAKRAANIAIIGAEGSGKSSLINCFENEIDDENEVVHIYLEERLKTEADVIRRFATDLGVDSNISSIGDLAQALLAGPRRIVIVHRTHIMYLRTVGGSIAPRAFFQLMLATRVHLLWLTSFRLYPWQRLDYLFEAGRYYTHQLTTTLHDETELRTAILRRQRTTGDNLLFAESKAPSRMIRKLRLRHELNTPIVQKALADQYFETLFRLSGGNLESAFYFWLLSLRAERAQHLTVQPSLTLDDRLIRNLERLDQFTLAELVGHGHLTIPEHAEIFRIEPSYSQLILENLAQLHIVVNSSQKGSDDTCRYEVSTVFQQTVVGVLTDLNTLY